jgi:hypothetical protein
MDDATGIPHPLLSYFLAAADDKFPPVDGAVTVLPALPDAVECSVAFTGHAVVATALPAREVEARGPDGFGASLAPDFLRYLAGPGGHIGAVDVTLVARGVGGPPRLEELDGSGEDHPRVAYARSVRTDLRVHGDERGLITLGCGLAGRREFGVELWRPEDGGSGGRGGLGRALIADALSLVPDGEPVFASVTPGNARSLRAFLAVGFVPIGSEVILRPAREEAGEGGKEASSVG